MREYELTADLFEAMLEGKSTYEAFHGDAYKQVEEEHWVKKTTKTLIEDDALVDNLYYYTKGRWKLNNHDFTKEDIKKLLKSKYRILAIYKVDNDTESGYEEEYHNGSRWEGDYNPKDAYWSIKTFSFIGVLEDFVINNPAAVKFDIKEEWVKKDR